MEVTEKDIKSHIFYRIARSVVRPSIYVFYGVRYTGREKVPKEGKIIIASNHISLLDPVAVGAGLGREVHFMGKAELFKNPVFGRLIKHLGCFPVHRGAGDGEAVNLASTVLEKGFALGIFPEGTRSKDHGKPAQRPKSGVAMLAQKEKCDVLPVAVYCKDGKPKLFRKYIVRVGDVIPYEDMGFTEEANRSEIKNASGVIWGKITALWEESNANQNC